MRLTTLTSNLAAGVRLEKLDGKTYVVAPTTMLRVGVWRGNHGDLFYDDREISRADQWNDCPITLGHPQRAGRAISARNDPSIRALGKVRNAKSKDGKLTGECWFDVEACRRIEPQLLQRLERGETVNVSTGLFSDFDRRPGTYRGQAFDAKVVNMTADHLAVLLDSRGACPIPDCGLNINRRTDMYDDFDDMDEPLGIPEPDWQAWSPMRPQAPVIGHDGPAGGLGVPVVDWGAVSQQPAAADDLDPTMYWPTY